MEMEDVRKDERSREIFEELKAVCEPLCGPYKFEEVIDGSFLSSIASSDKEAVFNAVWEIIFSIMEGKRNPDIYKKIIAVCEPISKKFCKPAEVLKMIFGGQAHLSKDREQLIKDELYSEEREIIEVHAVISEILFGGKNRVTVGIKKNLVISCELSGEFTKARRLLNEILPFYKKAGDELDVAEVLGSLGDVCRFMGDIESSKEYLVQSLAILEEKLPKDSPKIADVAFKLGTVYSLLGNYRETKKYYEYALSIYQKSMSESLFDVAKMFHNLGICLRALSDYPGSKKCFEQALQILEESFPENEQTINTLLDFGRFYSNLGDKTKADEYNKKALMILERPRKELIFDRARSLLKFGKIFTDSKDYAKAEQYLKQALETTQEAVPTVLALSNVFHALAILYYEWGCSEEKTEETEKGERAAELYALAKKHCEDALINLLKLLPDNHNHPNVASAYLMIGDICSRLKDYPEAKKYHQIAYEKYISYFQDADTLTARALFALGKDYDHLGKKKAGIFYMKLAANMIQNVRANISESSLDNNLQRSYTDSQKEFYRTLADMLAGEGRIGEAQRVMAMLKEEELSSFVRRNEICDHQTTTLPYIREEERQRRRHEELVNQLRAKQREKEEQLRILEKLSKDDKEYVEREAKLDSINRDIERIQKELREFYLPVDDALKSDGAKQDYSEMNEDDIEQIRNTLKKIGRGAVLLRLFAAKDRVRLFFTAPDFSSDYIINTNTTALMRKIADFRNHIEARIDVFSIAKELYDIFIQPVSEDFKKAGARVLIIFLDGPLRYLPVSALHSGKRWLVQDYDITIETRMNSLSVKDRSGTDTNFWNDVAAMGVTEVPDYLQKICPPIPWVEKELKSIVAPEEGENENGLQGIVRLNGDFLKRDLERVLDVGYSIAHIATHYKHRLELPLESFLLLGNGYCLTLGSFKDLASNFSKVKLVILSCCNTALNFDGEDVEGLPETIMQSGAMSVIATLWSISDSAAADFMPSFYEILKKGGTTKAEALCLAQREFIKKNEYSHPYFWAPFILMGDWS